MTSPSSSPETGKEDKEIITQAFKTDLKKLLSKKELTFQSPNITTKKNVSWADPDEEYNEKNPLRGTPYPNPSKKIKISNSTPIPLSFADSDSEDYDNRDNSFMSTENLSRISKLLKQGTKRKRTKKSNSESKWTVTSCEVQIKPDKTDSSNWQERNMLQDPESESSTSLDSSSENIENTVQSKNINGNGIESSEEESFDRNESLAKKIISKVQYVNTIDNDEDSESEESSSEDLETSESESESDENPTVGQMTCDKVVFLKSKYTHVVFENSCDESDSELSDSSLDQIFNPVVLDKKSCEVINFGASENKKSKSKNNSVVIEKPKCKIIKSPSSENNNTISKDKKTKKTNSEKNVSVKKQNGSVKKSKSKIVDSDNNETINESSDILNESVQETSDVVDTEQMNESKCNSKIIEILQFLEYIIADEYCIMILKHPLKLYFHGKLSVKVISGSMEVLGHKLKHEDDKEIEIYSPRGDCFLCFETLESGASQNIATLLKNYKLRDQQIEEFCLNLKENDCMIAVKDINNKMVSYLQKHVAQKLYPETSKLIYADRPLADLESKLNCLFEMKTPSWKVYRKNEMWPPLVSSVVSSIKENPSRTLICGGKSVGKSVLLRYMINKMLNDLDKVVCIDLDPGQSEFTVAGCVSVTIVDKPIFGPNYTHLMKTTKSYCVGDVNISRCLDRYFSCVKQLLNYCKDNISSSIPWIINYMGFSQSMGTDLIVKIINLVSPTLVLQIHSGKPTLNYSSKLNVDFVQNYNSTVLFDAPISETPLNYNLRLLLSKADYKVSGEWECEPRQIREMCILSYFSQMLGDQTEITAVPPYTIKLSSIKLHHVDYTKENVPAAINGNLVALCCVDDNEKIDNKTVACCVGFGIVRGIDVENDDLYLLTPVAQSDLEMVNCLMMGSVAIPPSVYMTSGHQGLVPYISLGVMQGTASIPKRCYISHKLLLRKK